MNCVNLKHNSSLFKFYTAIKLFGKICLISTTDTFINVDNLTIFNCKLITLQTKRKNIKINCTPLQSKTL